MGLAPGLVGPTLSWGTFMLVYKYCQQNPYLATQVIGLSPTSPTTNFLNGLQASFVMTVTANPVFLIKTRMMTQKKENRYKGLIRTNDYHF